MADRCKTFENWEITQDIYMLIQQSTTVEVKTEQWEVQNFEKLK